MTSLLEQCLFGYKLLVTIVPKGKATKVRQASNNAGAEGATILPGRGTGVHEFKNLFGHSLDPEREVILTLVPAELAAPVLESLVSSGGLHKPGKGIAFMIDVPSVAGVVHCSRQNLKGDDPVQKEESAFVLIITIVNKGFADMIVDVSKEAGAEGGTIVYGRGTGIHEQAKLFGIPIEPEKEMILTLVPREKGDRILEAILDKGELCKPGRGVAFVLDVEKTAGINHPVC